MKHLRDAIALSVVPLADLVAPGNKEGGVSSLSIKHLAPSWNMLS
jgi:hypothetical protein